MGKRSRATLYLCIMMMFIVIFGTTTVIAGEFTDGEQVEIFFEENGTFSSGNIDEVTELDEDSESDNSEIFLIDIEDIEEVPKAEDSYDINMECDDIYNVMDEVGNQTYANDYLETDKINTISISGNSGVWTSFKADETCFYIVEFYPQGKIYLDFGDPDEGNFESMYSEGKFSIRLEKDKSYGVFMFNEDEVDGSADLKIYKSDLIVEHTRKQKAVYGETKTLKVTASSSAGKIKYEWYEFAKIPNTDERAYQKMGVTKNECKISAVTAPIYKCEITDGNGCMVTAFFRITMDTGLSYDKKIYKEPVGVYEGQNLTLKAPVKVAEGVKVQYVWVKNGAGVLEGENSAALVLKKIKQEDIDAYCCVVTDEFGNSIDIPISLVEIFPKGFKIETEYKNVLVCYGEDAILDPKATPNKGVKLTYTWYLRNWEGTKKLTDKNTETYTVKENKKSSGTYVCVITDGQGTEKEVEFNIVIRTKWSLFGSGFRNLYVTRGNDVKLSAKISNGESSKLTYTWYEERYVGHSSTLTQIEGATKSSYTVKNIQGTRYYICVVQDEDGNQDSYYFTIFVGREWNIDYNKTRVNFSCAENGTDVELKVYVNAPADRKLSFQWKILGEHTEPDTVIAGAVKSAYTVKNLKKPVSIACVVTDQDGNKRNVVFDFGSIRTQYSHIWEDNPTVDKKSTCLKEGKQSIHCSVCDAIKEGTTEKTPKSGHSWGEWKVTKAATYETEGEQERVCTVCEKKQTEVIKKKEITSLPKPESFKISGKTEKKDGKTERKTVLSWKTVKYADGYRVYRKVNDGQWETLKKLSGNAKTSYTDTDVKVGECYYYRVRAYYSGSSKWVGGDYTASKKVAFKPDETKFAGTNISAYNQVKIAWEKVKEADGYYIYRKTGNSDWKKIADVSEETEYLDKTAEPGIGYYYRVRAYCKVEGEKIWGAYSDTSEEVTTKLDKVKISSLKSASSHKNTIKWEKVPGAEMYQIYCKVGKDGSYQKIKATSSLSYTHKDLKKGTKYYYKVRAYKKNSAGEKSYSSYSAVKSVTCK